MFTYRNLMTVGCAAVLAFGLAACGDNDDGPSTSMNGGMPTMDLAWDMLDGETIEPGTYAISSAPADLLDDAENVVVPEGGFVPGSMVELGGYVLTCSGTVNCSVTVDDDGNVMTEGTIMVAAMMDSMDPMDPMVPMAVAVTLPADLPDDADLQPMAETLMIAAGESDESGGVMFDCAAGGEACEVTVAADGSVTSTGGTVTATLTAAVQTLVEERAMAIAAGTTGRAIGVAGALGDNAATTADITSINVLNTVKQNRPVRGTPSFASYAAGDAPTSITGWSGATYEATEGGKNLSLTVYHDREEPMRELFSKVYVADTTGDPGKTSGVDEAGVVAVDFAAETKHLDKTQFPQATGAGGPSVRWDYAADHASNPLTERPLEFTGMLQGANGKFACTPGPCTVTVTNTATGPSYVATGTWTFTPASKTVTALVADADYLYFGYWVSEPGKANKAGDYVYDVRLASGGTEAYPTADFATLQGEVTYQGAAAGMYAVKTIEGGVVSAATDGAFTADAELVAKFGDATAMGSIAGSITNFRGDMDMSDWSVSLRTSDLALSTGATPAVVLGDYAPTVATDTNQKTSAKMGEASGSGQWNATFHGDGDKDAAPSGVAGEFDAHFTAAHIAGAFGAERVTP